MSRNSCAPLIAALILALVLHQPFEIALAVARYFFRIEIVEGFAEILTLAQDRDPRKTGLESI
jgi:hypothetical protein